jgi:hypothetical protein
MSDRNKAKLVSGGHKGAEAEFGRCAQRWGLREDTLSFEGHQMEWSQDVRMLSAEELVKGDVSMEIVSQRLGRSYTNIQQIRRVVQLLFHMVKETYEVFVVGWIQPDNTVQGGTGWGVELAKFFNRPVWAYDQEKKGWFRWDGKAWVAGLPMLPERPFAGTGTRNLTEDGRRAIQALFERSFGAPAKS